MKRSRMQQLSIEVTVGAFVLMIVLALGYFTILLSPTLGKTTHTMDVEFSNVTGLLKGDKVYLQGVDVGRVKTMDIKDRKVLVTLILKYPVKLREGYRISVEPSSVLGGRYVAINEGPLDRPEVPANTLIEGTPPVDFIGEAGEAVKSIRKALDEGGILGNLEKTLADVRVIAADLKEGKGSLGKLLRDDTAYDKLVAIETNLLSITAKIDAGGGTLSRLINDDSVYTNLQAVAANLRDMSDRVNNGEGTLGRLLSKDDSLYRELSATASNLNGMTAGIASGKGTLGKLVNNEELYNEIRSLIGEIRAAIDDLRETSPVASFSSVFLGAF